VVYARIVTKRDDILAAARTLFAERGFDATTMRVIAADAGVDVALVAYYFGAKDAVFTAAMDLPVNPAAAIAGAFADGVDGAGMRLARAFVTVWEAPETGGALLAMLRSAASNERAGAAFAEFIGHGILVRYQDLIGGQDAQRRTMLVAMQMVGLAMLRYVLEVEPIASLPAEEVIAVVGPVLQHLLNGPPLTGEVGRSGVVA